MSLRHRFVFLACVFIAAPALAFAQEPSAPCPGLLKHPMVQEAASTVGRRQMPASGDSTGRSSEITFRSFHTALAYELRNNRDLRERHVIAPDLADQDMHALLGVGAKIEEQLTPQIALRCFPIFVALYEGAKQAEDTARLEQDNLQREAAARAQVELQREHDQEEERRRLHIAGMKAEADRMKEREKTDREYAEQARRLLEAQRLAERQQSEREAEEMKKPHNVLRQVYRSYALTKRCYEDRQGYEAIYISDAELERARGAAKVMQTKITEAARDIDADTAWKEAVSFVSNVQTNRFVCQSALRSLEQVARQQVPGQGSMKKDF